MSEPIDPREQLGEHGEWDVLAVGWALSALDPEDEERFADHLPGCARCTATVREALYTVADLAYALPDEAPPPALKPRVMAAVAAEPRTSEAVPETPAPVEPEEAEEWPLGEPHPGSPGYGIDWFAKPSRSSGRPAPSGPGAEDARLPAPDELGIHRPPVGDRRADRPGWDVDEPTIETRRPGLAGADTPTHGAEPAERGPAGQGVAEAADAAAEPDLAPGGYRGGEVRDVHVPRQDRDDIRADVVPFEPRRRRWVRRVIAGVAVAAVLALIAGLLVSNARLRDQQDDLRRIAAQREAAIQQLTANAPARVAALTANGQPSPDRRATLVVRGDQIEIIVETLGATTGNETYWLWTLRCDTPTPTDLKPIRGFTVTQSEFSVRDIGSDPGVAAAPCFAISSELGSATPKAPRQVVAVGQPR